ncbi:MAG: 4-hydroxy-tetrahydrodipicolinate synthase [Deltaproteobacteria bacterium]|nr:4-hydroxy-tetrahydrodipicolinate synthase [Deltaproteobacteria bacterium]
MFKGCFTAIVTPFKNNRVDTDALTNFIRFQIKSGIAGIVPCGSTGEAATLTYEEHYRVINISLEAANAKIPVIAGTGSNSTAETITLTKYAERAGADAALLSTPYYNKPTQRGLYEHYKAVAEAVTIPLILYNVPGRTGVNMLPETVARLSELKNIVGIKEATGNLEQISNVIEFSKKDFIVLSGDDATTLPLLSIGGHGTISVTSNVAPGDMVALCSLFCRGKMAEARKLHYKLQQLNRVMFIETNPVPVKTALALMGLMGPELRLPLVGLEDGNLKKLKAALKAYGLLKGRAR